jgi:hypothetical protein
MQNIKYSKKKKQVSTNSLLLILLMRMIYLEIVQVKVNMMKQCYIISQLGMQKECNLQLISV